MQEGVNSPKGALIYQPRATPWVGTQTRCAPSGQKQKSSITHNVFLIILNIIQFQKSEILFLKSSCGMMFPLILDIRNGSIQTGLTDRKNSVATLPSKMLIMWRQRFHPSTAIAFNFLYKPCYGLLPPQLTHDMNMIFHTANSMNLTSCNVY